MCVRIIENDSMNTTENSEIERLTDDDFNQISRILDCEFVALKAVQQVATNARGGFFVPGKPAILFEGHVLCNQPKKRGLNTEDYVNGNDTILYPKWNRQYYKVVSVSMNVWSRPAKSTGRQLTLLPVVVCFK